ncbi:PTS cellobiose transporter subunit IIC [Listeria booriae]|uniref:PTS cellobiose transporter subunit IIC n=1 Tax=Listeria booriae TaxID=1552123 RepID=UPI00162A404B|nr:PTS cellobiose transporter subunit IIC [Listeria booriae]MBC1292459.1 PTS cellobiose transporter subunit IIC [Listeria booriae]
MNKFMELLGEKLMPFGSIAVVLMNLPFWSDSTKETLQLYLGNAQSATMSIMTVFVVFGIGYALSNYYKVEAIYGGAIALASFLILTPFFFNSEKGELITGALSLDRLGAKGMFIGMITAFVAAELYRFFVGRNWTIKMPPGVPPAVAKSFAALIPAILTLSIFLLINIFVQALFNTNLHDVIYTTIQKPLVGLGSGIVPTLIALFFVQVLWFFGLHGQIIVNSVMDPIWNTLMLENLDAYKAGLPLPHIITKPFMEVFTVGLGGSGMTLAVVITLAFFMKSKQSKEIGRLALGPGLFNVNEPILFGMPIVLNATILIPWILAPLVVTLFNYLVMAAGIVPPPTGVAVPWTVPIIINGILATNSWLGGALQVVDFFIVFLIWYPFLKLVDRSNLARENEATQE